MEVDHRPHAEATEAIPAPGSLPGTEEWSCGLGAGWMPWKMGPGRAGALPVGRGARERLEPLCLLSSRPRASLEVSLSASETLHIVLRALQALPWAGAPVVVRVREMFSDSGHCPMCRAPGPMPPLPRYKHLHPTSCHRPCLALTGLRPPPQGTRAVAQGSIRVGKSLVLLVFKMSIH